MTNLTSATTTSQLYIDASGLITKGTPPIGIEPRPLNNQWTGTNYFASDVSFNGTNTIINSSTIGLSSEVINICGGVINISGKSNITLQQDFSGTSSSQFGYSVSLSSDGNTMAVGSPYDSSASSSGAVRIYSKIGTTWSKTPQAFLSNGQSFSSFGNSVSLSSDGNTLAVGSYTEPPLYTGAVRIYVRTGTSWSTTPQVELSSNELYLSGHFGSSVSLSSDGNTLAVGSFGENSNAGAVRIYSKSGSTWSTIPQIKLITDNTSGRFGNSVSLSSDGNTLAVGSYIENSNAGAVRIFVKTGTSWSSTPHVLLEPNNDGSCEFGNSVSLSSDGNTLAVGLNRKSSNAGAVRIFVKTGTSWTTTPPVSLSSNESNGRFGYSVSLSSNGNTLAVGSYIENSNKGAVRIYVRTGTSWSTTPYVSLSSNVSSGQFGHSVSLSSDGNTIAVGSNRENSYAGAVRVYYNNYSSLNVNGNFQLGSNVYLTNIPLETKGNVVYYDNSTKAISYGSTPIGIEPRPLNNTWTGYNTFTNDVSLNGTTQIVGNVISSGTNTWSGTNTFTNDVSLNGITVVNNKLGVGNPNPNSQYALDVSGQTYMSNNKIINGPHTIQTILNTSTSDGLFGTSCALSNDGLTLAVGSNGESSLTGALYVYTRTSVNVPFTAYSSATPSAVAATKLTAGASGEFGYSCSLSSDGLILAVGSYRESATYSGEATYTGAVYIYQRTSLNQAFTAYSNASQSALTATRLTAGSGGYFGISCALSGDGLTLSVGASNEGSIYIYTRSSISSPFTAYNTNSPSNILSTRLNEGSYITGFGTSCALSNDGRTLAVGSPGETSSSGALYVYTRTSVNVPFTAYSSATPSAVAATSLTAGGGFSSYFGKSCSLSSDGLILSVGAYGESATYNGTSSNTGAVYIFQRTSLGVSFTSYSNTTPSALTATRLISAVSGGYFGYSCSLSKDGLTLVVGSIMESSTGAAYIFTRTSTSLSFTGTPIKIAGYNSDSQFGIFCALSSDGLILAVGANNENSGLGALRVYKSNPILSPALNISGNASISGNANISGSVSIGKSTIPNYALDVSGTIFASADVFAMSDIRSKKDIVQISDALDKVKQMRGCYFTMRDTNKRSIGLIAQETQQIIPEAVSITDSEDKYLGISYGNIVGLLVEAIKDSDIEVNQLKMQNASLTTEVASLTGEVASLTTEVASLTGEVASLTGEVASLTSRYDAEISTLKSQVQLLLSKLTI